MFHTCDLAFTERWHAVDLAGDAPAGVAHQAHGQQVVDVEGVGNRAGHELVGGGDDGEQVTLRAVAFDQLDRLRVDGRQDHLFHEGLLQGGLGLGIQFAPDAGGEGDVLVQDQGAVAVLLVEGVVARPVGHAVGQLVADEELAELVVGVERQQGVVEVE